MTGHRLVSRIVIVGGPADLVHIALVTCVVAAHVDPRQTKANPVLRAGVKQPAVAHGGGDGGVDIVAALVAEAAAQRDAHPPQRVVGVASDLLVQAGVHKPGAVVLGVALRIGRPGAAGFAAVEVGLRRVGPDHTQVIGSRQAIHQRTGFDLHRQ